MSCDSITVQMYEHALKMAWKSAITQCTERWDAILSTNAGGLSEEAKIEKTKLVRLYQHLENFGQPTVSFTRCEFTDKPLITISGSLGGVTFSWCNGYSDYNPSPFLD